MRVAVVAGPDPGHAFPAVALCLRLRDAGDEPVLFTGTRWRNRVRAEGVWCEELPGLRASGADRDAGARLHARAAQMSTPLLELLRQVRPDVVVADVLTACGGLAAERAGLGWVELSPHPLYLPSRGLPPIGSGLAPGHGMLGMVRDAAMRGLSARSWRQGLQQRRLARLGLGLAAQDRGPTARLVATLPALELPRPDWPPRCHLVGPLLWDPVTTELDPPPGDGALVLLSASTAVGGASGLVEAALAGLTGVRLAVTQLDASEPRRLADWAVLGAGTQQALLAAADVVVCGGGHGMLARSLLAGVPVVAVPGGGDQWELVQRAARQGSALVVRPLTPSALALTVRRVLTEPAFAASARRAACSVREVADDPVLVCRAAAR